MSNALAKKFTPFSLILFALPNMIMMLFLSLYTIVDGIFVSRYVGTVALSALNMVFPVMSIEMGIGIMLSTGSSAIIAQKMGLGKTKEAKALFSFIVLLSGCIGIVVAILGNIFIDQMVMGLGASQIQFELCKIYGQILFSFAPFLFLQMAFQTFFITAGKPTLGLMVTVAAGLANIVIDYILIGILKLGIAGAAIGTGISYVIPAMVGLLYFSFNRKGSLHFVDPVFNGKMLLVSCSNGSSEMIGNLANAVTTYLFNYSFMRFYGEEGVAAITIVLYFQFVFSAIYFGYAMGVSPIISFKYGGNDTLQLKTIIKNSMLFYIIVSGAIFILSRWLIKPAMMIFTESGSAVFNIALAGFSLFSVSFLLMGINIFASAMFTALSNGRISAIISFSRTLIFIVAAILLLPLIIGESGLWLAVPAAEGLGLIVSLIYMIMNRTVYQY